MPIEICPNAVEPVAADELPSRLGVIVERAAFGTPEQPWIVSSAEMAGALPDGTWFAIVPEDGARGALVYQKTAATGPIED